MSDAPRASMRADKWLWFARFFKTRSLAARTIAGGHLRVNGTRLTKPAQGVGTGDVLTFPQGRQIRVIEVVELGTRRGPASEAQSLYLDRTPAPAPACAPRFDGGGRPTKKVRRQLDAFGARGDKGALE